MAFEDENNEYKLKIDRAFFIIFGIAFLIVASVGILKNHKKEEQEFLSTASVENSGADIDLQDFVGDFLDEKENELHVEYGDGDLLIEMVRTHLKGGRELSIELNTTSLEGNVLYVSGVDPNGYPYEGKLIYEKGKVTLVSTDSHWGAASDGSQFIFIKK